MESRYFLFPDQTLENTKISDRAHALHITDTEWHKIEKHLDRKKDIQELLDKEEKKRRYLSEGNRAMTEKWDNTLEKMRESKDKARAKTTEEIQEEKVQKYYMMREEQEKLRKEYIENVKKKMFRTSGVCKNLNSAFMTSEVLYEREKQKDFKQFLKKHDDEIEENFAKIYKENALKEIEEKKEAAQKLAEKKKQYGAYLQQVVEDKALKEKTAKQKQIIKESEDNIKAVEEVECFKRMEEEEKMKQKKELAAEMEKNMMKRLELEMQLKQEDKEMDEVAEIYKEAKHRIDCLKKEKEKEIQNDIINRRQTVANLVGAVEKSKTEAEERQLEAAIAERDAIEEAKIKIKAEYNEKLRIERLEDRKHYLNRKEAELKKEAEIRKWEMLNKYKIDEVTKKYEEEKKKKQWKKILEYRRELLDQMDENEEERRRHQEFECLPFTSGEQDATFFDYADEILTDAKKRGRSTYPIEKAVLEYKKINNILAKNIECSNGDDVKKSLSVEAIKRSIKDRRCRCITRKK